MASSTSWPRKWPGTIKSRDFRRVKGSDITLELLQETGFREPIFLTQKDDFGPKVPDNFEVADLIKYLEPERKLPVINVKTQKQWLDDDKENPWTVKNYIEYWKAPVKTDTLNIISLEVSECPLGQHVNPPELVMQLDWAEKYWPKRDQSVQDVHPAFPQRYLLMSVATSFTDFHIDMGGSAVWYNPVKGMKVFLCLEPTEKHLQAYQKYVSSQKPDPNVWKGCIGHLVTVNQGEVVLLPSGWIHAVHTPCDSIVFGGNFCHSLTMDMSLRIYKLERETDCPPRFQYPSFEHLLWVGAKCLSEESSLKSYSKCELKSFKQLAQALVDWRAAEENSTDNRVVVPAEYSGERADVIISNLCRLLSIPIPNATLNAYEVDSEEKSGDEFSRSVKLTEPPPLIVTDPTALPKLGGGLINEVLKLASSGPIMTGPRQRRPVQQVQQMAVEPVTKRKASVKHEESDNGASSSSEEIEEEPKKGKKVAAPKKVPVKKSVPAKRPVKEESADVDGIAAAPTMEAEKNEQVTKKPKVAQVKKPKAKPAARARRQSTPQTAVTEPPTTTTTTTTEITVAPQTVATAFVEGWPVADTSVSAAVIPSSPHSSINAPLVGGKMRIVEHHPTAPVEEPVVESTRAKPRSAHSNGGFLELKKTSSPASPQRKHELQSPSTGFKRRASLREEAEEEKKPHVAGDASFFDTLLS